MKRVERTLALAALLMLTACVTSGQRYTGDTQYYWADEQPRDGVLELWSCREPHPFRGGDCLPDAEWPDGGLGQ